MHLADSPVCGSYLVVRRSPPMTFRGAKLMHEENEGGGNWKLSRAKVVRPSKYQRILSILADNTGRSPSPVGRKAYKTIRSPGVDPLSISQFRLS
jgi:hypothetical protein